MCTHTHTHRGPESGQRERAERACFVTCDPASVAHMEGGRSSMQSAPKIPAEWLPGNGTLSSCGGVVRPTTMVVRNVSLILPHTYVWHLLYPIKSFSYPKADHGTGRSHVTRRARLLVGSWPRLFPDVTMIQHFYVLYTLTYTVCGACCIVDDACQPVPHCPGGQGMNRLCDFVCPLILDMCSWRATCALFLGGSAEGSEDGEKKRKKKLVLQPDVA